ncbi:hypothetical protein CTAM01_03866 [Colletotrichum tamarilloi]|uniref:Uncharacterized protein n=1 Tax=Colletotrichum tamarilloi TaxID=1209934 RepID=A0ABQ9RIU7_9PEZI|nr:uncharacterized protein CTAM01_03866 [Colletotrichum tamarilloi]KAK1504559.1 hypothetical protein CTAM01_03866 [Colletotrichum tamarilloi]
METGIWERDGDGRPYCVGSRNGYLIALVLSTLLAKLVASDNQTSHPLPRYRMAASTPLGQC